MGKRTMTGSEVHARTKNRHEEQALQSKLRSLRQAHLDYMESLGKTRQEIVRTRRSGVRTTGTSPLPRELLNGSDANGDARESTMTLICSHFRRPWAYAFCETSYNAAYREACLSAGRSRAPLRRSSAPPSLHGKRAASAVPSRTYSRASLPVAHARCASAWDGRKRSLNVGFVDCGKTAEAARKTSTESSEVSSDSKEATPQRLGLHVYVPSETEAAADKDNCYYTRKEENGYENGHSDEDEVQLSGREYCRGGHSISRADYSGSSRVHYVDEDDYCEDSDESEQHKVHKSQASVAEPQRRGFYSTRPPPLLNSEMNRNAGGISISRRPKTSIAHASQNGEQNHSKSVNVTSLSARPKSSVSFQKLDADHDDPNQSTTNGNVKMTFRPKSSFVRAKNSSEETPAENGSSNARPKSSVVYSTADKHDNHNGEVSPNRLNSRRRSSVIMSRGRRLPEMPGNMTTATRYSYPNKTPADEQQASGRNGNALTEEQKAFARSFKSEVMADQEVDSEIAAEPTPNPGFGHVILYRGRRLRNYVRPQDRYRVDPFRLERRERLLTKLSIENPDFLTSLSAEAKTGDVFPKSARQRAMMKLIALNEDRERQTERYDPQEELQARIAQFLQSMEAYCLHPKQTDTQDE